MNFKKGERISPEQAMDLAISEAEKGSGFVSPNPLVGCVLVDKYHNFLSSGFHAKLGKDHAEIDAIKKISVNEAMGGVAYVTLEPCSHQGRTPPCAPRMAQLKLSKIVCGLTDPNPLVSGKGFDILRQSGTQIEIPPHFSKRCEKLTEIFLYNMHEKKPYVVIKVASTTDGKITDKDSPFITGAEARRVGRRLRAHYDATLIGAGTLLADNPILDFRDTEFAAKKQNKIIIWDPKGISYDFLPTSKLAQHHKEKNIFILSQKKKTGPYTSYNLNSSNITNEVLYWIYQQGIYSIYVEGGAKTIKQFIEQKLCQKLLLFVSPKKNTEGLSWTGEMKALSSGQSDKFYLDSSQEIDGDRLYQFYSR